MNTPKSFKPYHGCFSRFQGHLDISAIFNPGEWTEVVCNKGKRMRSKRFAHSVALGPSNNQAGTNLRSAHAGPMSHWKWRKNPPTKKLCEAWQQEENSEA